MSAPLSQVPPRKRTKIVATIGPASDTVEAIRGLVAAGANVFRLNFSHGTHESHLRVIGLIREVCVELNRPLGILGDLSGPKLRLQPIAGDAARLEAGDFIELTSMPADGAAGVFGVNFPDFHLATEPGEQVLVDDGAIRFTVVDVSGTRVRCRADNSGVLLSRKGVNLPHTRLPLPALTEKDRDDLVFALRNDVDMLALSFVRTPEDLHLAREVMEDAGRVVPLLAKIEKAEAVESIEAILEVADGAMVARGDLGIEVPIEQVPAIQKRVIALCNQQKKPVITATQMLDSMIRNPRPTRAEVTDIYNAIMDGTDAVMLSGETASGNYPLESVEVMDRVARQAETILLKGKWQEWRDGDAKSESEVTSQAAVSVAERLDADCIIIPTWTGTTARQVSQFRPSIPIFACSTQTAAVNALCLVWGVESRVMAGVNEEEVRASEADAIVNAAVRCAREHGFVEAGQKAVVLAGVPLGVADHTNFLRVIHV